MRFLLFSMLLFLATSNLNAQIFNGALFLKNVDKVDNDTSFVVTTTFVNNVDTFTHLSITTGQIVSDYDLNKFTVDSILVNKSSWQRLRLVPVNSSVTNINTTSNSNGSYGLGVINDATFYKEIYAPEQYLVYGGVAYRSFYGKIRGFQISKYESGVKVVSVPTSALDTIIVQPNTRYDIPTATTGTIAVDPSQLSVGSSFRVVYSGTGFDVSSLANASIFLYEGIGQGLNPSFSIINESGEYVVYLFEWDGSKFFITAYDYLNP